MVKIYVLYTFYTKDGEPLACEPTVVRWPNLNGTR